MASSTRMLSNLRNLLKAEKVQQDVVNSIFYVKFNSHVATVDYEKHNDVYDLVHSNIPEELQGHGLGSVLAEKIFAHLIDQNKKMKLTCEFLDDFYKKNLDKYKDYVVDNDQ